MPACRPREVVEAFFRDIRSGNQLERVHEYVHDAVAAHQLQAEAPQTVVRSPADYADHVRDMLAECGPFELQLEAILEDGDCVYVRWRQQSNDAQGQAISDLASAVYRVAEGRIAEYWIQIDREGNAAQRRPLVV